MPEHEAFSKAIGTVLGKSHNPHSHGNCSQQHTESHGMARQDPGHSSTSPRVTQCSAQGPFAAQDANEQGLQLHIASAETFVQGTHVAKQATT